MYLAKRFDTTHRTQMTTYSKPINNLPQGRGFLLGLAVVHLCFLLAAMPVNAQQVNGTPGSPEATRSINGQVLPAPDLPFGGEINLNASQSKPFWPARVVPR